MKVVVRGHCIKTNWGVKSSLTRDIEKLEERLRELENEAIRDPAKWIIHRAAQRELTQAYHSLGNVDYKSYMRRQHSEGDKPGRVLAWLLKSETP